MRHKNIVRFLFLFSAIGISVLIYFLINDNTPKSYNIISYNEFYLYDIINNKKQTLQKNIPRDYSAQYPNYYTEIIIPMGRKGTSGLFSSHSKMKNSKYSDFDSGYSSYTINYNPKSKKRQNYHSLYHSSGFMDMNRSTTSKISNNSNSLTGIGQSNIAAFSESKLLQNRNNGIGLPDPKDNEPNILNNGLVDPGNNDPIIINNGLADPKDDNPIILDGNISAGGSIFILLSLIYIIRKTIKCIR